MTPKSELEGEMGAQSIGKHAKLMSQAMRKLTGTANRTKTTLIFINQMREKIGVMFGNPWTTSGGNALKFYASIRAEIKRGTKVSDKDGEANSNRGKITVVKNKTYPPYRESEFDIEYGKGISRASDVLDYGVLYGAIEKSGSWYSVDGTRLGQGREVVKKVLEENIDLLETLEDRILKHVINDGSL